MVNIRSFSALQSTPARLLLIAVAFHLVLSIAISFVGKYRLLPGTFNQNGIGISFAIDSIGYHREASEMAQLIQQGRFRDWINYRSVFPTTLHIRLYSLGFAAMGKLIGFRTLAAEPLNLFYYISMLVLTYAIGIEVFGEKVGRLGALMVGLWPSLLLHTTQLLRDPLFISAMLLLIWTTLLIIRRDLSLSKTCVLAVTALFAILVALLCRPDVKEILVAVLLIAGMLCVASQVREHRFRLLNILAMSLIVSFAALIPKVLPAKKDSDLGTAQTVGREKSEFPFIGSFARRAGALRHKFIVAYPLAGSNVDTDIELSSASDLLRYLPRAAEVGFFAPFPSMWVTPGVQVGMIGRLVSGVEMCVMYVMFALTLITLVQHRNRLAVWFLIILTSVGCIALGYVVANVSALYRMRYTFFIPVLILGTEGVLIAHRSLFRQYDRARIEAPTIG